MNKGIKTRDEFEQLLIKYNAVWTIDGNKIICIAPNGYIWMANGQKELTQIIPEEEQIDFYTEIYRRLKFGLEKTTKTNEQQVPNLGL